MADDKAKASAKDDVQAPEASDAPEAGTPFTETVQDPFTADKLEVYRSDSDGLWYWHRRATGNSEIISQSEGYADSPNAEHGALRANPDIDRVDRLPSDYNREVDG